MATDKTLSPQLQQFLAPPESEAAHSSAYYTNPVWAMGVRIMANLRFAAKAGLISVLFLVPLAWLSYSFYTTKNSSIEFSAKEHLGVEYSRQLFPLIDLAQQLRRDATSAAVTGAAPALMADVKSKLQAQQAKLAEVEKRLGSEMGSGKAYAEAQKAFTETERASGLAAVFAAHSAYVQSLIGLMGAVTDGSNLTLDPDMDSFYLMDAVFYRLPDIVESAGKLRGLGLAVMKAGVVTPEQQSLLNDLIPIAEFQSRNMTDGLEKVYAYNAGLKSKVNSGRAMDDTRAFFALARQSVINKQDFAPDTQARYLELANKGIGEQYQLSTRLLDELDALIAARVATMVGERIVVTVVLVMGLLLAAYFFYCFILVNGGSLRMISTHLREMAEGDLRKAPSKPFGRDESSLVVEDMRVTYVALHGLIRKVRHSARALHAAANEIAHASTELAARTENAASTLEEQASAMEEIGSTVGGTAERAQMASTFANDNAHVAEKGGHVFGEVTATMREIHTSSSRINDIIGTIDGIAFQTNILALNAAVEAARAGESGRGFAVVASEVRSLAGRSADAAREIKSLISQSVEKVEGGTRVVESAGGTMKEVVTNARQINQFLTEIAAAAREQSVGVSEVGRSIQELDKTTQQNAALVEETTSAAAALREQADLLQEEIANFRVA